MPEATHGKPMSPDSVNNPITEIFRHSRIRGSRLKPDCSPMWTR